MHFIHQLKEKFLRFAVNSGQERVRLELLHMSDSQLTARGFSRELLLQGPSAWPWRYDSHADQLNLQSLKIQQVSKQREIRQAINELNQYSDSELAELGIARHSIDEAVIHGRASIEAA